MREQVFHFVWCQVFAATCVRLHAEDQDIAIETATTEADWAAANAVEKWDPSKQAHAVNNAERCTVRITVGGDGVAMTTTPAHAPGDGQA